MKKSKSLVGIVFFLICVAGAFLATRHYVLSGKVLRVTPLEKPDVVKLDYYSSQVQPVFNARCVACHSCYNSPCQLNLSSYSGLVRGASKVDPYNFQMLEPLPPTRLDIDATTEVGWRHKGFFSVVSADEMSHARPENSNLWKLINLKNDQPSVKHDYNADTARTCPANGPDEIAKFVKEQSFAGMPYGLPGLTDAQRNTIGEWLKAGAPGPSSQAEAWMTEPQSQRSKAEVSRWEELLNRKNLQARLSARYFYEHLFVAHITFDPLSREYFRLVRAKNAQGLAEEIPTVRPFDDPGPEFFYRFKKIDSTLVAKTQTVFVVKDGLYRDYEKQFLSPEWRDDVKKMPAYGNIAANAFTTFQAIPRQIRYQFFLDNARYFIMTFIKGPVCRGQTALNVINDQFWVMFVDPKYDMSAQDKGPAAEKLPKIESLMYPPASNGNKLKIFTDLRDSRWQANVSKIELYKKAGTVFTPEMIWNGGENPNALLTVYRHFDSANVRWGAEGGVPKTAWVMDYQIFEDIYYNLVAGYNLFGATPHQLTTRLYMNLSRITSEDMFLTFLPKASREKLRNSWSEDAEQNVKAKITTDILTLFGASASAEMQKKFQYPAESIATGVEYFTKDPKVEFLTTLFKGRLASQVNARPDLIDQPESDTRDREVLGRQKDVVMALRKIAGHVASYSVPFPDMAVLRVRMKDQHDLMFSIIHNKAHANVNLLFFEDLRRRPQYDSIDIVPGLAADYPNYYFQVDEGDIGTFVEEVSKIKGDTLSRDDVEKYEKVRKLNPLLEDLAKRFGISRHRADFWDYNEWVNSEYAKEEPIESGLVDLNRYVNE